MTSEGSLRAEAAHTSVDARSVDGVSALDERLPVILAHGRSATAFRTLGPEFRTWPPHRLSSVTGLIAYAPVPGAAVAVGEPVAPLDALVPLADAFVEAMAACGKRASFFATEGRLAHAPRLARRRIGEQPVWDPQAWDTVLRTHRSLREQLRRSRAKGVRVVSLTAAELDTPSVRRAVAGLQQRWHAVRSMPPMHFLVTQALFEGGAHRRTFIARQGDVLVGVLSLAPLPARDAPGGWIFEHLLRDPDAPNGTAELLVDAAMRALAADGVRWATLGLAPLHGPIDRTFARIRRWSQPLFNFAGLSAFKHKLGPQHWEPIYLAWPRERSGWMALVDGLRAFAGGSFIRFGAHALLRGPTPVLQLLEWLLVPWTVALALAPTAPWFPSRAVQGSWVLFDGLLLLALRTLRLATREHGVAARRRAARLATALAVAISGDALLTLVQVVGHAAPWHAGGWSRAMTVLACAGPLIAAAALWGTARRTRALTRPLVPLAGFP